MAKNESLIKDSVELKTMLRKRIVEELNHGLKEVCEYAKDNGVKINSSQLSRYLSETSEKEKSKSMQFSLSEKNIVCLAYLYGIYPILKIHTMPVFNRGICEDTFKKVFKNGGK